MKCLLQIMLLTAGLLSASQAIAAITKEDQQSAVMIAAKVYDAIMWDGAAQDADWAAPKQLKDINDPVIPGNKLHVLEFTAMDPSNGAYHRVRILINTDGGVTGAEVIYAGR